MTYQLDSPGVMAVDVSGSSDDDSDLLNPPPILGKAAYHGLLLDLCKMATRHSEASPVAIAANILSTFGAMIGRGAYQHIGDGVCHARPYFLLTGRTGKARKGTSEYTPMRIFQAVEGLLGVDFPKLKRHEGGLSTGEGLGWAIRDDILGDDDDIIEPGIADKRFQIVEAEFAGAMAAAARDKNNLSATIRTAWDGRVISPLVKNAKWAATDPHILITGHITAAELIDRMSDVDALSGFMNRFVILHIVRAKLVPLPQRTPDDDVQRMAAELAEAVRFATDGDVLAKNQTEVKLSSQATKFWCAAYPELTQELDGIAGALLVRTEIYCRMFAMLFALLDRTAIIEPPHIEAALEWISYWKASVGYIFQTLAAKTEAEKLQRTAKDVHAYIGHNPQCSRSDITTCFRHSLTGNQITAALNHLLNAAPPLIRQKQVPRADGKPGKGSTVFWIVR